MVDTLAGRKALMKMPTLGETLVEVLDDKLAKTLAEVKVETHKG